MERLQPTAAAAVAVAVAVAGVGVVFIGLWWWGSRCKRNSGSSMALHMAFYVLISRSGRRLQRLSCGSEYFFIARANDRQISLQR